MLRTLLIICFVASPAIGIWLKGFKVKYGANILTRGSMSYISMPDSVTSASSASWVNLTDLKPTAATGYESLELWCAADQYKLCMLYDDSGYVAGMQLGVSPTECIDNVFDWAISGFTNWTFTINEITSQYWTTYVYFISVDTLATPAANRTVARNENYTIQGDYYYVTGYNGTLTSVPINGTELSNSTFKKQSCIPGLGEQYFYNMTSSLVCAVDTLLNWIPMSYKGQSTGVGFMMPVNCTFNITETNYFETPTKEDMEIYAPDAPTCLYDYGDSPGYLMMHLFFLYNPYYIYC